TKLEEVVSYGGATWELGANRWQSGSIAPKGHRFIERFRLEAAVPVWAYACADALLEKRVWMEQGANTTYVQYRLLRALEPAALRQGESLTVVLSTEAEPSLDGGSAGPGGEGHAAEILARWEKVQPEAPRAPAWVRQLVIAASQFVVKRPLPDVPDGLSVIAG